MIEKENAVLAAGLRLLYERYLERHGLTADVTVRIVSDREEAANGMAAMAAEFDIEQTRSVERRDSA